MHIVDHAVWDDTTLSTFASDSRREGAALRSAPSMSHVLVYSTTSVGSWICTSQQNACGCVRSTCCTWVGCEDGARKAGVCAVTHAKRWLESAGP